ncbi:MAG: D-aminoacyl-tRNA deacylase [Phycisphaerales bacterium]|nr:D-aminoacyl-tRNA deacylase [Phycisphaerales bacterium]
MRAVIQRVLEASVSVVSEADRHEPIDEMVGSIESGLLVYVGIGQDDETDDVNAMATKIRHLRIFHDDAGKMNLDVMEAGGAVLVISNFTLLGDARKGRRPAFTAAAPPDRANELYRQLCEQLRASGLEVQTGRFRHTMAVRATNDGPINILIDTKRQF